MALITDPDDLNQGTEVVFDTTTAGTDADPFTIQLVATGNLDAADGVTMQALYSFCKDRWKNDSTLIKYPFPLEAITAESFEFKTGWKYKDTNTVNYIRNAGFAVKLSDGSSAEEYAGIITLGSIGAADQVYYTQASGGTPSDIVQPGAVNQCVKVYGDSNNGNVDYRSFFNIYVREQAKTFADSNLSDIGVSTMTYQAYRFPLANAADLKISESDVNIAANLPYTDINITYLNGTGFDAWANAETYAAGAVVSDGGRWYSTAAGGTSSGTGTADDTGVTDWTAFSGERLIGSTYYAFNIIIDADVAGNGSEPRTNEIYEKIQYDLRQSSDIDAGAGTVRGDTADSLLSFVGDTLVTSTGVFIDDFNTLDQNTIEFYDVSATKRTFPFQAAGTITFSQTLVDDADAIYRMYYTDNFGTGSALLVQNASDVDISGTVGGNTSINFTYDYDGDANGGSAGTDKNVTVVAIGLTNAQYISATGTITRSTQNSISLVSSLERNYENA